MVELFNIQADDNYISCDYSPEQSGLIGSVTVNVDTEEVERVDYSEYEYGKKMYVAHVRAKLMEIFISGKPIPEKAIAQWF